MPIDGGLIVGYLTAALARGGRRLTDRAVDALLDRLVDLVQQRLGSGPFDTLGRKPGDAGAEAWVAGSIDAAARMDPALAEELSTLVAELDRRGGRSLVNQVYADMNVQAIGGGVAVGRDFTYLNAPDPSDLSGAPLWAKTCIGIGSALAVAGLGIFFYTLFTGIPDAGEPGFGETPAGIPLAFGVFFVGFILVGIGSLGRAMSRHR
jgi:hypothetical protein